MLRQNTLSIVPAAGRCIRLDSFPIYVPDVQVADGGLANHPISAPATIDGSNRGGKFFVLASVRGFCNMLGRAAFHGRLWLELVGVPSSMNDNKRPVGACCSCRGYKSYRPAIRFASSMGTCAPTNSPTIFA